MIIVTEFVYLLLITLLTGPLILNHMIHMRTTRCTQRYDDDIISSISSENITSK